MERVRELLRTDEGGGARALGGLLFATGILVLIVRRTQLAEPWGDAPVFLIVFATALFLYVTGFAGGRLPAPTRAWQVAFVVFGILLLPLAGFTFLELIDGSTGAPLNAAWIFGATAAAAFAAALVAGVRVGCLLGALALLLTWLFVWDELLENGIDDDLSTLRWLMLGIAAILLVVGALIALRGRPERGGSDLITVAGLAAVYAAGIVSVSGQDTVFVGATGIPVESSVDTSVFWDALLLVIALGLLVYASLGGVRGPGYVGAIGLVLFIAIVGFDLDDSSPAGKVVGWPLVLLLAAAALLVVSVLPALRRRPD